MAVILHPSPKSRKGIVNRPAPSQHARTCVVVSRYPPPCYRYQHSTRGTTDYTRSLGPLGTIHGSDLSHQATSIVTGRKLQPQPLIASASKMTLDSGFTQAVICQLRSHREGCVRILVDRLGDRREENLLPSTTSSGILQRVSVRMTTLGMVAQRRGMLCMLASVGR
ncbi:uncharacterized protein BO95DRAFT_486392 [Aspergillus brunneoviolaceus CBS 621.78]|uniref:Uncharacterized protein n=1 Tax=Aspergillus brunneoviolaceus CBS 621.78 TaxID=1450534 RepID=A0ACD1FT72_9EURO|nr:hypothetical protein BO95DRAFT_486392 [Aspergillus brunneoviolaceus CBS 621.78]RAH40213.1 hypothetical protein BO95DRAFT_486392 [Aspergillus brunneoviolaceus CBS 621.78]